MFHVVSEMHQTSNGSGNGNGSGAKPLAKVLFRPDALLTPAPLSPSAETEVLFKTEEGAVLHGSLVRMTRHSIVFEMYHPAFMPRLSEVLQKFTIIVQRQKVYSGRAVVSNLMDASSKILYEATLDEIYWQDFNLLPAPDQEEQLAQKFKDFLKEWQKFYKLLPEFKVVIADMQTFFHEVRIWLDKVEAEVYLHPPGKGGERTRFEHQILQRVEKAVLPPLAHLFQRFETAAAKVEKELRPHHASYAKYALHPAVLCAPFMYRTFQKPLGYAGDYEMVNMMVLNPYQGDSIFAKILNAFFLRTPPVAAHRNRIDYLAGMLESEAYRLSKRKKPIRVLNPGCGPAAEIQRFLGYSFLSHKASLT
ncbi:MAG: hypothetical protein KGJ60_09070, partial [Verrucomicrobiota bacterium]|nr:hypothetical protein [Verrucomicrobiota bacterium]